MASTKSWQYLGLGCAALLLTFSTLTCTLLLTAQWWVPAVGGANVASVCVGYTTTPQPFHVGFNWILPWLSSMPPVVFDQQMCQMLPWPPFFPPKGALVFPP